MYVVTQDQLNGIWAALNEAQTPTDFGAERRLLQNAINSQWFYLYDLEDFIMACDRRIYNQFERLNLRDLVKIFKYKSINVVYRPRKNSTGVIFKEVLPLDSFAAFLIDLEYMGFNVNPQPLIDYLKPFVERKPILTDSELSVFWSEKTRMKSERTFQVERDGRKISESRTGKFSNGYRYSVLIFEDGNTFSLTIAGPRHRRRTDPVKTDCPECGYTWFRGDTESSANHRTAHKKRMQFLDPQPHEKMLAEMRSNGDYELVNSESPRWKHKEIYQRALAFKREKRYDFVQWESPTGDSDRKVHGFLFTDDNGVIKGAAAFRWREPPSPEPPFWGLQWIWVCPRYRRQGLLESRWKALRQRFGDFLVESPISHSMQAFLEKHGDESLMDWPSKRCEVGK